MEILFFWWKIKACGLVLAKSNSIGHYKKDKTHWQCTSFTDKNEFHFFHVPIFGYCPDAVTVSQKAITNSKFSKQLISFFQWVWSLASEADQKHTAMVWRFFAVRVLKSIVWRWDYSPGICFCASEPIHTTSIAIKSIDLNCFKCNRHLRFLWLFDT